MADVITGSQLDPTEQDLVARVAQKELEFASKLLSTVTDVSQFAVKGARSISFPKLTSAVVIDRAEGVSGDASALTATIDTLNLDKNAYSAYIIDSMSEVQSNIDAKLEFAKRHGNAHGRERDLDIIIELEVVGDPTLTAGDVSRDTFLEMREGLCTRHADMSLLHFLVGCDQERIMLGIDDFVRSDAYGSSNIPDGVIGKLYGVSIVVHSGVAADTYYMYEKSGLAIGFQRGLNTSEEKANSFGTSAVRVAFDQLYGVKGMQLGVNGVGATESALVVKDNNP